MEEGSQGGRRREEDFFRKEGGISERWRKDGRMRMLDLGK